MTFGFGRDPILSLLHTHTHLHTCRNTLNGTHTAWILSRNLVPYTCTRWARVQSNTQRGYSWRGTAVFGINLSLKLWILLNAHLDWVSIGCVLRVCVCCTFANLFVCPDKGLYTCLCICLPVHMHRLGNANPIFMFVGVYLGGSEGLLVPAAWSALRSRQTLWVTK